MSSTLGVLCRPALAPGFALAGVAAEVLDPAEPFETAWARFRGRADVSVVLIEDAIYDALPDDWRARLDRSAHPVVVPFPGPTWQAMPSAEARVIELLRRAIGYRVKLR